MISPEDEVDRWLRIPIPEILWHYTSIAGFEGIVSSKEIYATDVRFLNDVEEFVHARRIAEKVVALYPEVDNDGWEARKHLSSIVSYAFDHGSLSAAKVQVFVASFSTSADELSQWRGYSRGTPGVSLGFDLRHIRPLEPTDTLAIFAPCVYKEGAKMELVREALDRFSREGASLWRSATDESMLFARVQEESGKNPQYTAEQLAESVKEDYLSEIKTALNDASTRAYTALLSLAGLLKDSSFEEEHEWRLVLPVSPDHRSPTLKRQFRVTSTSLVPYVSFPLFTPDGQLPLRQLILGPGSWPERSLVAAASFLIDRQIPTIPTVSSVPFRPS